MRTASTCTSARPARARGITTRSKGSDLAGGPATGNVEIATGSLAFGTNGSLTSQASTAGGAASFVGAAANQPLSFDFGKPTATGGTGLDGLMQFGSGSSVSAQSQDGYASGSLSGVKIDTTGTVVGVYTNRQSIAAGQLAIAKFQSNDGLGRAGHNLWVATRESGDAALGAVGTGGRANADPLTRMVTLFAMAVAVAAGGHRIVIGALLISVRVLPPGSTPTAEMMGPEILTWFSRAVECWVGLALPATAVCRCVQLALAFVSRAAPSRSRATSSPQTMRSSFSNFSHTT